MKATLLLLMLTVFTNCFCQEANHRAVIAPTDSMLLKYLDTNITLYDASGSTLHYYQYKNLVKSGDYQVSHFNGKPLTLQKLPEAFKIFNPLDSITGLRRNIVYTLGKHVLPTPPLDKKLLEGLPKGIDTTLIIYDQYRTPLKFQEYFARLFYYHEFLALGKGEKSIWHFADRATQDRPAMYKTKADTLERLQDIYRDLLKADKILVLKSRHQVSLQRGNKTFMTVHCELGKNPIGDKTEEGDGRTPEGFYTIVSTAEKGKYGRSLQISYPDEAHIAAAKQKGKTAGKDVMIHGTGDTRAGKKDWTNGCIALANNHIDSLFKYVFPGTTIEIRK